MKVTNETTIVFEPEDVERILEEHVKKHYNLDKVKVRFDVGTAPMEYGDRYDTYIFKKATVTGER